MVTRLGINDTLSPVEHTNVDNISVDNWMNLGGEKKKTRLIVWFWTKKSYRNNIAQPRGIEPFLPASIPFFKIHYQTMVYMWVWFVVLLFLYSFVCRLAHHCFGWFFSSPQIKVNIILLYQSLQQHLTFDWWK